MKKNILIVLLAITTIGLAGFVCYDKVLKKEEKVVCEKCPECEICENKDIEKDNNVFKTSNGKELGISYSENFLTLFRSDYNGGILSASKKISDSKIKNAKIMTGFTAGEDEEAVIIMEDGSVYNAYFGYEDNNLMFVKVENLEKYLISEVIAVRYSNCGPDSNNKDMCGSRWLVRMKGENSLKLILNDGTTKTFTGDSNSNNW